MVTYTNSANSFPVTTFTVSPVTGQARYTSIQAAITDAALIATTTAQQTVYLYPGVYTENLTFTNFVNVCSLYDASNNTVAIEGQHTYANTNPSGSLILQGLTFTNATASSVTLTCSDAVASSSNTFIQNCFFQLTGTGSTNIDFDLDKNLNLNECDLSAASGGRNIHGHDGGDLFARNCNFSSQDTASLLELGSSLILIESSTEDFFSADNGSSIFAIGGILSGNQTPSAFAEALAGATVILGNALVNISATYIVIGSGTVLYTQLTPLGSSSSFDPLLSVTPLAPFSNNNFNYIPTPLPTTASAGSASMLPVTPEGYLPVSINGTSYVIPFYLP